MSTALRLGSRLWWGVPVLVASLWMTGMLAVPDLPGLPVPAAITTWGLPLARFARDIAAMVAVGGVLVGGLLMPGRSERALRWAAGWCGIWAGLLVVQYLLTAVDVLAIETLGALRPEGAWTLLADTSIGHVFAFQILAIGLALVLCRPAASGVAMSIGFAIMLCAVAAPSLLVHAGMPTIRVFATASLVLHAGAAALWVGGLAVTVGLVRLGPESAPSLLPRFSALALWCVIVIAGTGVLNALVHAASASALVGTLYGSLILGKAVLLGWLIRLGWLQRKRVVARWAEEQGVAARRLGVLAAWELTAMGAAIAISVVLLRTGPPPAGTTAGPMSALTITLLALALPILLAGSLGMRDGPWRRRLRAYPEVPAIALLLAVVVVAGTGVLTRVLGTELGTVASGLVLVAFGWLWAVATLDGPRRASVVILMIGWPFASWLSSLLAGSSLGWRVNVVSLVLAEIILALVLSAPWAAGRSLPGAGHRSADASTG